MNAKDNGWPDREVWDEMPVHYIEMEHPSPAAFDPGDLLSQAGKVRRKNGRNNFNHLRL